MKKIITLVAVIASAQASAYWGNGSNNGMMDHAGNGDASGEGTFSMSFSGKGNARGNTQANTANTFDGRSYGYNTPYYGYAPVAPVAPAAPVAPEAK